MATGTGKTKTSLEILRILSSEKEINSCIISTSGNTLLDQWYSELINFINNNKKISKNLRKIFRHYDKYKESEKYLSNPENSILIISRDNLQKYLKFVKDEHKKIF